MVISKSTVKELEKIHHLVALFILQLPLSSSQLMGWMEAGLQPFQQRLDTKSVLFAHTLITGRKDQLTKSVVDTTLADRTDPWTKRVQSILEEVGIQDLKNISKSMLKRWIWEYHVSQLRQAKAGHSSLLWLTEPWDWFKSHINDSKQCAF